MDKDKIAFLVDTPLQLLNTITYITSNNLSSTIDLYVVKQFKDAEFFIEGLRQRNFIDNIYVLNKEKKGLFKHLYTILGLVTPNLYCKIMLDVNIKQKKYEAIYFAAPTKMFDFIIGASEAEHIYGIEDGIGSYSGDIFHDYLSKRYMFMRRIFGNDYKIEKLFLRTPDNYLGPYKNMVCCLIGSEHINISDVHGIFHYKKSDLYEKNVVYVNQPLKDFKKEHIKYEKKIIDEILSKVNSRVLVRLHPRETFSEIYSQCKIDDEGNMWELICEDCITENTCIIGMFSTSQFVPKYFYNIEPMIVFTFRLYKDLDTATVERYERQSVQLMDLYSNKERVKVINSLEEIAGVV